MTQTRPVSRIPQRRSFLARTWMLLLFLVILLGGAGAYYYYNYATIASAEVAYVTRGTAVTSVYGTVSVDPIEQAIVRTRNNGTLSEWKVKANDVVKKDQVIALMTNDTMQRQIDSAQSALSQAKIRQSLGPPSAADLKNQEIEVDKIQKLIDANNIAPVEGQKAHNQLLQLRDKVQNEALALDNEVDTCQRVLDGLNAQNRQNQILAPIDGIILSIMANPGEFLPEQTQLARIGSSANQIVASVNEEDIGELKKGMKAQIRLYAYPDKNLTGTLLAVGSSATNQVYPVSFTLDDTTMNVLPGMTGEMNVIIGEHKDALTIPTRAIRRGNAVWTVVNGVVKIVHINVGFHTLETSEIANGLDEGTAVILSNQDQYHEGMRVRALVEKKDSN